MKIDVITLAGVKAGTVELNDAIFGLDEIRGDILRDLVVFIADDQGFRGAGFGTGIRDRRTGIARGCIIRGQGILGWTIGGHITIFRRIGVTENKGHRLILLLQLLH